MDRRKFVNLAGAAAAVGAVTACSSSDCGDATVERPSGEQLNWKMVTAWPLNYPGLGTGANRLAETITRMSGGRLTVKVYGANDLVPPFEVFDAVSRGTAEMGHAAAYYWKGKVSSAQFFSTVPFGLNAQEMTAWLYYGGGLELWRRVYEPFGIVPLPAGNSGVQMGGWFNREISSVEDLKGLKMRMPGLGGEVLDRAGGTPVTLPGSELFTALQTGAIDATEWVGPYNDLAFGLYQAARYYYYPGWHEPGTTLEGLVNKAAFDALPDDLQAIVELAAEAVNGNMLAEFTARNGRSLAELLNQHKVDVRRFPEEVLDHLKALSDQVVAEVAGDDPLGQEIFESFISFRDSVRPWHQISEVAYYDAIK